MDTTVVNLRDAEAVRQAKADGVFVLVDRTTIWGNPFRLKSEADRERVLAQYREWLDGQPALKERARRELRGKVLGCWCAPKACHGDMLAAIANEGV